MTQHKYIYWRRDKDSGAVNDKGERWANVHIIGGYGESLTAFLGYVAEMRETFPEATDDQLILGKIITSRYVKNMSIVAYNAYLPDREYEGFTVLIGPQEYGW